jgi:hypothetical protein
MSRNVAGLYGAGVSFHRSVSSPPSGEGDHAERGGGAAPVRPERPEFRMGPLASAPPLHRLTAVPLPTAWGGLAKGRAPLLMGRGKPLDLMQASVPDGPGQSADALRVAGGDGPKGHP